MRQDQGGNFLSGSRDQMAGRQTSVAHFDFQFLEEEFLFPALSIEFEKELVRCLPQSGDQIRAGSCALYESHSRWKK